MAQTTDNVQKLKAAKEVRDLRAKIKTGMQQVLAIPMIDSQKQAASEYQRRKSGSMSGGGACPCGKR